VSAIRQAIPGCLVVVLATLVYVVPLIARPGFPAWTHEALRYPELLAHVVTAMEAGIAYPRWLPDLAAGHGYPTFVFYPPLLFLLAGWACAGLGLAPASALVAVTLGFAALGVTGVYRLARAYADRPTSAFVTLLYALTPYGFVNLYVRGDLSEFVAMQLVPWCLWSVSAIVRRSEDGGRLAIAASALAASLAAIVYAHPLLAVIAWTVTAVLLAAGGRPLPPVERRRLAVVGAGAFLAAAVGSAPYWGPALALGNEVQLDGAFEGHFQAGNYVVLFTQLFARPFEFGLSAGGAGETMTLQLGAPHAIIAVAGAWFGRRLRLPATAFWCYVVLVMLMTPLGFLAWRYVPVLRSFQFPWRLLGVTASLQALCMAGWAAVPIVTRWRRWAALALLVAATAAWHVDMLRPRLPAAPIPFATVRDGVVTERTTATHRWRTYGHPRVEEFLPRTADRGIAPRGQ
jgi:hypothetical protein